MLVQHYMQVLVLGLAVGFSVSQRNSRRDQPDRGADASQESSESTETSSQCPQPFGFFADAEQCDKYYECRDGEMIEKLCDDGKVFNDYSPDEEKCDLPFNIDCTDRPKLQTPIPSLHCRRKNGYFSHEDPRECGKFYFCVDGMYNAITCPADLVYNEKTGICTWADEAKKKGCGAADLFHFNCPSVNESYAQTHPRYPDPEDCQFFYVCINGITPRKSGCKLGQAFDDVTKQCNWARKIPECANSYSDRLTDAELDALEHPPAPKPKPSNAPSRRKSHRPNRNQGQNQQQ